MKILLMAALTMCMSTFVGAQTPPKKSPPSESRMELKSKAKQVAAGASAADHALTPEEMTIADQIHVGRMPCELGSYVQIDADPKAPGFFHVQTKAGKYRMFPVVTATGAIRLEDHKIGAVWLQLANKSMLMNQRLGQRIADDCMNPQQALVAQALLKAPAPHLLDAPNEALVPVMPGKVAQEMVPNTIK